MTSKALLTPFRQEGGFILVTALWIMVIIVMIGIASVRTTSVELQIAGNDKFHKMAFYNADSGVYSTPKVIGESFEAGVDPAAAVIPGVTLFADNANPADGTTFYREILGFAPYDASPDMQYTLGQENVSIDINRLGSKILIGGGAEFASGSSGVGVGSTGGVAIQYLFTSTSTAPNNAQSVVAARYRKIPGVAGGL